MRGGCPFDHQSRRPLRFRSATLPKRPPEQPTSPRKFACIIYQLSVSPEARRGLVGAMLVKAMFDRAAYGCRLFCCWCAQDIEANRFWESLGFVPLAYRAGSEKKGRVHIFWQKRIRPGDQTTPWWFPAQTTGGSIRQDRLVLPIPPGVHWSGAKPILLPTADEPPAPLEQTPAKRARRPKPAPYIPHPQALCGGLWFASEAAPPPATQPPAKTRPPRRRNDPQLIAAARELRDRWLEEVERDPSLILPHGRYDLVRALPEAPDRRLVEPRLIECEVKALPAAA